MLSQLDKQIIEILYKNKEGMNSEQLSFMLSKSSKTIQNRIRMLEDCLQEYGIQIESKKGKGYVIKIIDESLFASLQLRETQKQQNDSLMDEVVHELVLNNDYIKADDLVEQLYISKSKLTTILNELRDILRKYDLKLETKPYYGIRIAGDEFNYRRFLSSNYVQKAVFEEKTVGYHPDALTLKDKNEINQIQAIVESKLEKHHYHMNYYVLDGFVIHLWIALNRIRKNMLIDFKNDLFMSSEAERKLADDIAEGLVEQFKVEFPKCEKEYIVLHLVSKRVIELEDHQKIPEEINELAAQILLAIKEKTNIDLLNNFDLRILLALHLYPLKTRLNYGIILKNPILEEVRLQCMAGYDIALIARDMIEEKWGKPLSEHEISYFALHFDVALKKEKSMVQKHRILIVCGSGRAGAQLLKANFMQYFEAYLESVEVCDVNELENCLKKSNIDYIFTTVPLSCSTTIPVFEFQFFLNENSIREIKHLLMNQTQHTQLLELFPKELFFIEEKPSNRDQVLHELVAKIDQKIKLPSGFEAAILERESFCGTDLLPQVALPHPIVAMSDESFISVMVLGSPILWTNRAVSLILLMSLSRNDFEKYQFIYDYIIKLCSNQESLWRIAQEKTYDCFVEELVKSTLYGGK